MSQVENNLPVRYAHVVSDKANFEALLCVQPIWLDLLASINTYVHLFCKSESHGHTWFNKVTNNIPNSTIPKSLYYGQRWVLSWDNNSLRLQLRRRLVCLQDGNFSVIAEDYALDRSVCIHHGDLFAEHATCSMQPSERPSFTDQTPLPVSASYSSSTTARAQGVSWC